MTSSTSTNRLDLIGAKCEPVLAAECSTWLQWIMGTTSETPRSTTVRWLLAHCDDGVTWGKLDDSRKWTLGSTAFGDLCPVISTENLIELRLFGEREELLIWRDESGFRGRWLRDNSDDLCAVDGQPARPHEESRILIGNKLDGWKHGFAHLSDGTGREQAVPIDCQKSDFGTDERRKMPLRLTIKHYFEILESTGAVRVAASRLVRIS